MRDYYANVTIKKKKRLELLNYTGHVMIPRIVLVVITAYWALGLAKYNNPEMTLEQILSPIVINNNNNNNNKRVYFKL